MHGVIMTKKQNRRKKLINKLEREALASRAFLTLSKELQPISNNKRNEYIGIYKKEYIHTLLRTRINLWRYPKITLPKILMQLVQTIEASEDYNEHTPPQA